MTATAGVPPHPPDPDPRPPAEVEAVAPAPDDGQRYNTGGTLPQHPAPAGVPNGGPVPTPSHGVPGALPPPFPPGSLPVPDGLDPGKSESPHVGRDSLLVRVCSWNVGEADPSQCPPEALRNWLLGDGKRRAPAWAQRALNRPDIIAVGLQEVDMTCGAMMRACCNRHTRKGELWRQTLDGVLSEEGYVMQDDIGRPRQLGGLQVLLFARGGDRYPQGDWRQSGVVRLIDDVAISSVASGFCCGTCWNKGTTACRLVLGPAAGDEGRCSICFINSHFAAKAAKLKRRNWEHDRVNARTSFPTAPRKIMDHDCVFWFGDLNYRLDLPADEYDGRTRKEVKAALRQECLAAETCPPRLVDRCDQLTAQIRVGRVFSGFTEARIDFRPTYKVLPGKERHDMRRQPSYTDRVLYWAPEASEGDVLPGGGDGTPPRPLRGGGADGSSLGRGLGGGASPSSRGCGGDRDSRDQDTERDRDAGSLATDPLLPAENSPAAERGRFGSSPVGSRPTGRASPSKDRREDRRRSFEPLPALLAAEAQSGLAGDIEASCAGTPRRRVVCLEYSAVTDMPIADHRPIHALFALPNRL